MLKRIVSAAVVCLLLLCAAAVPSFAEEELKINVEADTYGRTGSSTQNTPYGDATAMVIDPRSSTRIAYIRFRYGAGADESLEYLQNSPHITLNLHVKATTGNGKLLFYGLLGDTHKTGWEEADLTKVSAVRLGLWDTTDNLLTEYPMTGVGARQWISVDVTDYVKSQADGVFAFKIEGADISDASDVIQLYTKEYAAVSTPYLSVSSADAGAVEADAAALNPGDLTAVTESFTLPVAGANGSQISWTSAIPEVIRINGERAEVIRPSSQQAEDAAVKLTAVISKGSEQRTKDFMAYVLRAGIITPSYTVTLDEASPGVTGAGLACNAAAGTRQFGVLSFNVGEEIYRFASSIDLRVYVKSADAGTVLAAGGLGGGEKAECSNEMNWNGAPLTVGAGIESGESEAAEGAWCEFDVTEYVNNQTDGLAVFKLASADGKAVLHGADDTFKPQLMIYNYEKENDAEAAVAEAERELDIPGLEAVSGNIVLPKTGSGGTKIEWTSSAPDIIDAQGRVTCPADKNAEVVLTATISRGGYSAQKIFYATVLQRADEETAVRLTKEWLTLQTQVLTKDGVLPQKGLYDVDIAWTCTDTTGSIALTDTGYQLTRPDGCEAAAELTAAISCGDYHAEKTFAVTVLRSRKQDFLYGRKTTETLQGVQSSNDDDDTTCWTPAKGEVSATYVLGVERKIGSVLVVPQNAGSLSNYRIELSRDRYTWETAYQSSSALKDGQINTLAFDREYRGKYLRLSFVNAGQGGIRTICAYAGTEGTPITAETIAAGLDFEALTGVKQDSVTKDFQLPSATAEGAALSWNSLSPEVIHISGSQAAVTRQSAAAAVTLVAQVEFSGSTAQRHFILKVPRQDFSGGGNSGGGGGGTGKPPAIQNFEYTVSEEEPESAAAFPDLSSVGWAREFIELLAANGIFQGRPDGTFDPGAPVMREEFVKILCAAFRLPESKQKAAFSDVYTEAWYAPYIASAAEAGIINGMGDGRFGAGMPVARQDIAVMLVRAAETLGYALPDSEETSVFSDSQDIALYAADSVRKLKALEAANGDEQNQFLPKRHASRAETAKLVCIVLQKLNLLA